MTKTLDKNYPRYKYHAEHDPIIVNNSEEESFLPEDEWTNSPADHGIITAPSASQMMKQKVGFDFEELKAKKQADKAAAIKKLMDKSEEESEEEETSEEETTGDEDENTDAPKKPKRKR